MLTLILFVPRPPLATVATVHAPQCKQERGTLINLTWVSNTLVGKARTEHFGANCVSVEALGSSSLGVVSLAAVHWERRENPALPSTATQASARC